ncbi:MAG: hypothetical protein E7652_01175 [Ruminococcaceae bacterium]|nr:hypothetical protein [Oscillospiraceae bacterium]
MDKQTTNQRKFQPKEIYLRAKTALGSFISNYISIEGSPEEGKEALNLRLNYVVRGLGFSLLGFLFGGSSMLFSTYPLGISLFCAASRYIPFIYVGLILSTLFITGSAVSVFLLYSIAMLARFSISYMSKNDFASPLFAETKLYRALFSSAVMLILGVIRCISDGFLWYDLFGLISGVLLAPVLTLAFCGALEGGNRYTAYHDIGLCAIMSFTVFALKDVTLFGFSASAVLAFIITLHISKECGMLRGGVAGLFAGLAYNVIYAPLFAIASLISGLFWRLGSLHAIIAALGTGIVYGIYADGFSALSALAPDLLCAALIYLPLERLGILPKPRIYTGSGSMPENMGDRIAVSEKKNEASEKRLRAMSDAMSSLAAVFYNLSCAEKKPEISSVGMTVEKCFEGFCEKCPRRIICWDEHYPDTRETLNKLSLAIYNGEVIGVSDVPEYVAKRCNRIEEIIEAINKRYSNQLKDAISGSKAEVFAIDYSAMAALLEQALTENAKEYEIDEKLTAKIKSEARYLNFTSTNLCVYGERKKRVIAGGIDLARVKLGVEEIQRAFERVLGAPLSYPNFAIEGDHITMSMRSKRIFKAEYAHISQKKEKEDINGDSISFFENSGDYFYALLSDGMGSGRDAALSSRLAGVYLDKMLRAGNKKAQAIEMLNSFLRQKSCESFATVDLMELDLLNGQASFVKSGAVPSYIIRGSSIFKIASNTMPVGIIKELNAEEVKFELEHGDVVVMISDGICDGTEDGIWLMDMLINDWKKGVGLRDMCEKILEEARERNGERDDMTVGMVKIKRI